MSTAPRRPRARATRASSWKWRRTGGGRGLRIALGSGDEAIIKEVERGEDYLKEEFERVLEDGRMSPGAMAAVREAYESVRRGHDEASDLKQRLEAAD